MRSVVSFGGLEQMNILTQNIVTFRYYSNVNENNTHTNCEDDVFYLNDLEEKGFVLTEYIKTLFNFHAIIKKKVSRPRASWLSETMKFIYSERHNAFSKFKNKKRTILIYSMNREKATYSKLLKAVLQEVFERTEHKLQKQNIRNSIYTK